MWKYKVQLDATDGSLLQNLLLAQHVSGTIMPIIRSSRVLYRWLLPVVLGTLVYRLLVWCGAVGYVSGLQVVGVMWSCRLCVRFTGCWPGVEL